MPNSNEPIKEFFRRIKIRQAVSKVPTGIRPLQNIHIVTVLLDWTGQDAAATETAIRNFFRQRGADVFIINPKQKDFTSLGRLRNRVRMKEGKMMRHEDLFISLATGSTYAERFEAAASPAKFKIGRTQTELNSYDIVLSDSETRHYQQTEVFDAMVSLLQKIK